jgi:hypothetical protein
MNARHVRLSTGLLALAMAVLPLSAPAQAQSQTETITGKIASIDDADNISLNDDRGFIDNVRLQQNTVINPPRTSLQPGMTVRITGAARGSVFAANQIDISGIPQQQPAPAPYRDQPAPPPYRDQPPVQQPQPVDPVVSGELAGGELTGGITNGLDSKSAFVGQDVILTGVSSADGSIHNATLYGSVTDVSRPSQGRAAQLDIHFERLQLRNGATYRVDGVVTQMNVDTKNNALKEVGGALAGMLIGNAIGKTVFGASGGGIVGAIGGFFVAKDNKTDVVVPQNSLVTVHLVSARRQGR